MATELSPALIELALGASSVIVAGTCFHRLVNICSKNFLMPATGYVGACRGRHVP